jgi:hypothetical protein
LDHEGGAKNANGDDDDLAAPTFSSSAMRFVQKVKHDSDDEDLLADNLDNVNDEL